MVAALLSTLAAALLLTGAAAAPSKRSAKAPDAPPRSRLAPLPAGADVKWSHSPYEAGDCSVCHARNDAKNPGPIAATSVNELCTTCHDDVLAMMAGRTVRHPPAADSCTSCHNPHNARWRKLLLADLVDLCTSCHEAVRNAISRAAVKHGAVTEGERCLACHDPHASATGKLLVRTAFDLCMGCHGTDGRKASDGKPLANLQSHLAENTYWHEPIRAKDCTSCHLPHGSANHRLLAEPYPPSLYAPYDAKAYGLCFRCHDENAISTPETTTLTDFRDGSRNLHHVHVNQKRGRTCRACHDVHASKHARLIRGSVPYGPRAWALEVGYTRLPTGGSCARTCHETKTYHYYRTTAGAPSSP